MANTLVLYESRYGCAQRTAEATACILSLALCRPVEEAPANLAPYRNVVLVFGCYEGHTAERTLRWAGTVEQLAEKQVAVIGVGLDRRSLQTPLERLEQLLGKPAAAVCFVPGELRTDRLSPDDRAAVERFCHTMQLPLADRGQFQIGTAVAAALELAAVLTPTMGSGSIPEEVVRQEVERFLAVHNTCALATGMGTSVRCTPIEYHYWQGRLWMLSEGGRKFAGLLQNPAVSLAVFDPYTGWDALGGVQMTGLAELVPLWSEEYCAFLTAHGMDIQQARKRPIQMNLIRVTPETAEFMWSGFRAMGGGLKQHCRFPD